MKIFAGGIGTETNTFSPIPTGLADFRIARMADVAQQGWGVVEQVIYGSSITTFRDLALERGWAFTFGLYAFAAPAGTTTRLAYESLRTELLTALAAALPVDMVLLFMHGAMVADGYDDCEADILHHVRQLVGPTAKIGVEHDLHSDITPETLQLADILVLFKEYPHIDVNDRAREVFTLTAAAALGQIQPTMARFDCRMMGTYRTPLAPMRGFVDAMQAMEGKEGILSVSLAHGFAWADVPSNSVYTLVITDNNPTQAAQVAERLGRQFFAMRHEVSAIGLSLDAALDQALAIDGNGKPVVIADSSDNPGGGAPGDATFALAELLRRKVTNVGMALFWDPIVVQLATAAGVGATMQVRLGGKLGPTSGNPLDLTVQVKGIVPNLIQQWPQTSGSIPNACGNCVCLHCQGIDIIVGSERTQVLGLELFTAFGLNPASYRLLVVKSTQHYYAAYAPLAAQIIYMEAPGALTSNFTALPFQRVDTNKYPWTETPFAE